MLRDPTALLNIQIAFMGIVLVVGLFYLWKMMKSLEAKMQKLSSSVTKLQERMDAQTPSPASVAPVEDDVVAQAFMKEVFGGAAAPMFLHPFGGASSVVIEETTEDAKVAAPAAATGSAAPAEDDVDTHSVVTTSTLSKSRVRKMTAEALREVCKERGLDAEGTRAVLMERILATLDD